MPQDRLKKFRSTYFNQSLDEQEARDCLKQLEIPANLKHTSQHFNTISTGIPIFIRPINPLPYTQEDTRNVLVR